MKTIMSGLNDPFLLADDSLEPKTNPATTVKIFKDDAVGEEPELKDNIDLIAVAVEDLVIQYRDLELLQQNITNQKGMCQSIAMEAEILLPGFINDERPIGFFTKHPSRTMLSVALEEVDGKKSSILEKLKNFIVEMFKRTVEWFRNLFTKADDQLATDDNKKLLANSAQIVVQQVIALPNSKKEAEEIITAAKERAIELQKQAQEQSEIAMQKARDAKVVAEAKKRVENVIKLVGFANSLNAHDVFHATVISTLHALLSKVPHVKKFFSDLDIVEPLLSSHEDSIASIIVLLADMQRAVNQKDYEAVAKVIESDGFERVSKATDTHARSIIEFKNMSVEFEVKDLNEFIQLAKSPKFTYALKYGSEMLENDMTDQKKLTDGMEAMLRSLTRMELLTRDIDMEAKAKDALEAMKNFNRSVIIPATQRIQFSYSVISQLLTFLNGMAQLKTTLEQAVRNQLKQQIEAKAKELGMNHADIAAVLS